MNTNSVIVITTHRTGVKFLANLLASFGGYNKYPLIVVACDYIEKDKRTFLEIIRKFPHLNVTFEPFTTNSFEFGGLYHAYQTTRYREYLLLSHSCEIVDTKIFDIVFEDYKDRSVAFGLHAMNWKTFIEEYKHLPLQSLGEKVNEELEGLGDTYYWQGHIGKYRRDILDKMDLASYVSTNMIEAVAKSEHLFTASYHSLDPNTVVLFPNWKDGNVLERKFGKYRLKIANDSIIKYKTHWDLEMVFSDMGGGIDYIRMKHVLIKRFAGVMDVLGRFKDRFESDELRNTDKK